MVHRIGLEVVVHSSYGLLPRGPQYSVAEGSMSIDAVKS